MRKSIVSSIIILTFVSFQIFGQTWSSLKRLTWTGGDSKYPSIATDSGSGIYAVWNDNTSGNEEIYYKRSNNGGSAWFGLKRLTWNTGYSSSATIAIDSTNKIHIVWNDNTHGNNEILYKRSTDGGVNWSALNRLTWNAGNSSLPSIATDSANTIHVAWYDSTPGNNEIFYKKSTDGGINWSGLNRLTWRAGDSFTPSIAAGSGSTIHIVWHDDTPIGWEIFYKRSTDSGTSWSTSQRLTWNADTSLGPKIAADSGGKIHVAWYQGAPGFREIFYKRSTDGGNTWDGVTRLTWTTGDSHNQAITSDSGNGIHVTWRDKTPGNYEIFYKRSTDSGVNWSGFKRLTWNAGISSHPEIAADSGNGIHVIWHDDTPGNYEINYKNYK